VRLSRRAALGLGAGGLLALAGARPAWPRTRGSDETVEIEIKAEPIPFFARHGAQIQPSGPLRFRSGLVLTSAHPGFGSLSGLWRSPDGSRLVAISDEGQWLTATVANQEGRLSGLRGARMAPILGEDGVPLWRGPAYDTESLAIADGVAFIGIERVQEVRRFPWAQDGVAARGVPIPVPPDLKELPGNRGLEAIGVAPPKHPLGGAVIAVAEQARPGDTNPPTRGWILTGPQQGGFDVSRSDHYDITDLAFLESGDALLLERRYSVAGGPGCRIRQLAAEAIRPGAMVDGPILFEADHRFEIDNMEGLALHRDTLSGDTVVTLISDDNHNPLQRTLLLEFALPG
jgi:hypothetical protein